MQRLGCLRSYLILGFSLIIWNYYHSLNVYCFPPPLFLTTKKTLSAGNSLSALPNVRIWLLNLIIWKIPRSLNTIVRQWRIHFKGPQGWQWTVAFYIKLNLKKMWKESALSNNQQGVTPLVSNPLLKSMGKQPQASWAWLTTFLYGIYVLFNMIWWLFCNSWSQIRVKKQNRRHA